MNRNVDNLLGWRLAGIVAGLALDRPPHGEKVCGACGGLPRAGRVRSRLNGSEGLAVASRRSGEGLGWRLETKTADG